MELEDLLVSKSDCGMKRVLLKFTHPFCCAVPTLEAHRCGNLFVATAPSNRCRCFTESRPSRSCGKQSAMELEDLTNPSPSVDTKISARLPVCVHFTDSCHYCKIGNLCNSMQTGSEDIRSYRQQNRAQNWRNNL